MQKGSVFASEHFCNEGSRSSQNVSGNVESRKKKLSLNVFVDVVKSSNI